MRIVATLGGVLIAGLLASCTTAGETGAASSSASSVTASASDGGGPSGLAGPSVGVPTAEPSPSATRPSSTFPPLESGPDRLRLELVADGLSGPVGITHALDGSGRLYVNQRGGAIRVIEPGGELRAEPFVDLSQRILAGGERGLLGLAFHPDYARNRRLFVHYSRAGDGATVISELAAGADGRTADPDSERVLLSVAQPFANHNGGEIAFGPDGYLYIGLGDGGSGGDPLRNGQNRDVLLGKILRIDVDGTGGGRRYLIPPDNPFAPGGAQAGSGAPEVWAYGLRNPWRFSFDPEWGDIYIGDVGQGSWEEIDRQPGDSRGGENYGWNVMEGRHCFRSGCDQTGYVKPIAEYSHDFGCSVTGGHVYRGAAQPELAGVYVFADYCSGFVFTLQVDAGTITPKVVLESGLRVSAFGTDQDGEIYLADLAGGGIYRVLADG
ncbi:MAG: PQQ-dependent sugar dehydrogenase [Candidatus Limnocylindria bacterium]